MIFIYLPQKQLIWLFCLFIFLVSSQVTVSAITCFTVLLWWFPQTTELGVFLFVSCFLLLFLFCSCYINSYNLKTISIQFSHQFVFITDFLVSKLRVFQLASEVGLFFIARYFPAHYGHIVNRATKQIHTLLWQLKLPLLFLKCSLEANSLGLRNTNRYSECYTQF